MHESWRYYDYLRRWGLLLLLGLALGALAGFGIGQQQKQLFKATATVSASETSFRIVSTKKTSDPKEAVGSILNNVKAFSAANAIDIEVVDFSIQGRYRNPLWKAMLLGGVVGALLAFGAAFVWDDVRALKHHRHGTFKDI